MQEQGMGAACCAKRLTPLRLQEVVLETCTLLNLRIECAALRKLALPQSKLLGIRGALPELTSLDLSGVLPCCERCSPCTLQSGLAACSWQAGAGRDPCWELLHQAPPCLDSDQACAVQAAASCWTQPCGPGCRSCLSCGP